MKKSSDNQTACTFCTGKGDNGFTTMADGTLVRKDDPRIEAVGTVDELNSHVGLLRAHIETDEHLKEICEDLTEVQRCLFGIGAYMSGVAESRLQPGTEHLSRLETAIEKLCQRPEGRAFNGFVLPGGVVAAAQSDVCRTVCRRMERRCLTITDGKWPQALGAYINRLADYFFALSLYLNHFHRYKEIKI